jgi:hypothetical protein
VGARPEFCGTTGQELEPARGDAGLNRRRGYADYGMSPRDSQPYLKLAPSIQFVSVELTYHGSVSEIRSFRR